MLEVKLTTNYGIIEQHIWKEKAALPAADLSILGVDVHSHLIPGIDDGAQTIEDSIELLQSFIQLGYKKVITTPHVMSDFYKNTPEIILSGLEKVRAAIKEQGLAIEIDATAEYNLDADFEPLIQQKNCSLLEIIMYCLNCPFFKSLQC